MLPGHQGIHHFMAAEHRRYRHHTSRKRLAQQQDIWLYTIVITSQHGSRSAQAGLDFVGNEQYLILGTQGPDACQIAFVRDDYPCFTLYWFNHKGGRISVADGGFKSLEVVIGNHFKAGYKGPEVGITFGVGA